MNTNTIDSVITKEAVTSFVDSLDPAVLRMSCKQNMLVNAGTSPDEMVQGLEYVRSAMEEFAEDDVFNPAGIGIVGMRAAVDLWDEHYDMFVDIATELTDVQVSDLSRNSAGIIERLKAGAASFMGEEFSSSLQNLWGRMLTVANGELLRRGLAIA